MRIAVLCNDRLALPALSHLVQNGLVVSAGVTDRVNETQLLVKQICTHGKVPVQQFTKKNFETEINSWLQMHNPDLVLVKTFPWRVPEGCLEIPRHGFVNFHYAPLPEWRGSNPLFWMIRNKSVEAGVSVHKMDKDFDSGSVFLQRRIPLSSEATFGLLCTQLAYTGVELTNVFLNGIISGTLKPQEQDHTKAKWYGRPKPADLFIDWNTMKAEEVKALVKACNPWNKGAATIGNGWTFGITEASLPPASVPENTLPGTILELNENNGLVISCSDKKAVRADVIYCEEGFYPGHRLSFFGFQKGQRLGK